MKKILYTIISTVQAIVVMLIMCYILMCFISFSYVPSDSMKPTFSGGTVLAAVPIKPDELQYGDIILFFYDDPAVDYPNLVMSKYEIHARHNEQLVKRLIGLPGDTIAIRGGQLYRNGEAVNILDLPLYGFDVDEYVVPDNCIYVLGDNRANSLDSRYYGGVPMTHISGKVIWWAPSLVQPEEPVVS